MPLLPPEQLLAQVRQWRQRPRWDGERVFAIRTDLDYQGPAELDLDGLPLGVAECRSDLEAREKLRTLADSAERGLILLVRARHDTIGEDVRCHFAGNQLLSLDPREVLKELFQATSMDPRIVSQPPLLEALLHRGAEGGCRLAPSGTLDLDFAWSVLLNMPELVNHRPDLVDLLRWSLNPATWAVVESLDPALQALFFGWTSERVGQVADPLAVLCRSHRIHLALPLGLMAGDLFAGGLNQDPVAQSARVRLENFFEGIAIDARDARAWMVAAVEVLNDAPPERRDRLATVVDEILAELKAPELAPHLNWSKQGFRARWAAFTEDLDRLPKRKWETGVAAIRESFGKLREHALANQHPVRIERAAMAIRLALRAVRDVAAAAEPRDLHEAAALFLREDSFVDWARFALSPGDPVDEVSRTYGRIVLRSAKERIDAQARFGRLLKDWHNEAGHLSGSMLTIEKVVERVVAPLAKETPVLLLVLDGMNAPVFHQLARDLAGHGWMPAAVPDTEVPMPVLSALPSLTRVSRWALFAGRLAHGTRPAEAVAFRDHPALAEVKSKGKPCLFAKGDLTTGDEAGLSIEVRTALAGTDHRVVSVLLNVIDDQLATGGQLDITWTINSIGILPSVLDAASQGGRTLVVLSDHGHILELGATRQVKYDGVAEARCRNGATAGTDEEVFGGERVRLANGVDSLILPITETLRYTQKAGGYHGGATDLETLIPMGVFTQGEDPAAGYRPVDLAAPTWWDWECMLTGRNVTAPIRKPVPVARPARKKVEDDLPLFAAVAATPEPSGSGWLEAFFQSPVYASQLEMLGRAAPKQEHVAAVLQALALHHGSLLEATLAKAIGEPVFRLQGMLARLSRLLNVDGYEVLSLDRESKTVRLNEVLLFTQFDLKA